MIAWVALAMLAAPGGAGAVPTATIRVEDLRVATVAYRLAAAGTRFCDPSYPLTGLQLHFLAEYAPADRAAAAALYRLDEGAAVVATVAGSPAARAGIAAGDLILAVNGGALPRPAALMADSAVDSRRAIEAVNAVVEENLRRGPARLTLSRNGDVRDVELAPQWGCEGRARLARSSQMNAFANRGYAIVTTRLLSFIQNDDELAVIVGHELAHVMLGHPGATGTDRAPRGLLRHFGKAAALSRVREAEADRLGLRLAWAAGYDVNAAIPFWRRFHASKGPGLVTTHPGLKTREKLVEATIAELGPPPVMVDRP